MSLALAMPASSRSIVIHGRVQGVGYRDAAVQAAFTLGRQRLGAQPQRRHASKRIVKGAPDAVERFVEWCTARAAARARVEGRRDRRRGRRVATRLRLAGDRLTASTP